MTILALLLLAISINNNDIYVSSISIICINIFAVWYGVLCININDCILWHYGYFCGSMAINGVLAWYY